MAKRERAGEFVVKEVVHAVPCREGEELRFQKVEVNGAERADVRYFARSDYSGGKFMQTPRGITIDPSRLSSVVEGVQKLAAKFAKK